MEQRVYDQIVDELKDRFEEEFNRELENISGSSDTGAVKVSTPFHANASRNTKFLDFFTGEVYTVDGRRFTMEEKFEDRMHEPVYLMIVPLDEDSEDLFEGTPFEGADPQE